MKGGGSGNSMPMDSQMMSALMSHIGKANKLGVHSQSPWAAGLTPILGAMLARGAMKRQNATQDGAMGRMMDITGGGEQAREILGLMGNEALPEAGRDHLGSIYSDMVSGGGGSSSAGGDRRTAARRTPSRPSGGEQEAERRLWEMGANELSGLIQNGGNAQIRSLAADIFQRRFSSEWGQSQRDMPQPSPMTTAPRPPEVPQTPSSLSSDDSDPLGIL